MFAEGKPLWQASTPVKVLRITRISNHGMKTKAKQILETQLDRPSREFEMRMTWGMSDTWVFMILFTD